MLLVLFVYSSCTEEKRPTPQPKARINVTPQTKEAAAISQLTASIDEISANLDVISAREGLLYKTTEHTNKKTKIIQQIRSLGALLAKKQLQIEELQHKAKQVSAPVGDNATVDNLNKMISFLSGQLKEKGERVTKLEKVAVRKDVSVAQLKYIIQNQANSVDALRYRFNMSSLEQELSRLKAKERQRNDEQGEVFYIMADKQTLKEQGLLKTSLFSKRLNNNNITQEHFTKADKKELKQLTINSKTPKILSMNPDGSYTLTENEDGTTTLTITDAEKFWNVSRYLIIQE